MMIRNVLVVCFVLGIVAGIAFDDEFEEEVPSTHRPQMLSESSMIDATSGEKVRFPCDVDDKGDFVRLWKKKNKDSDMLYADEVKIIRDPRFKLSENDGALVISSVLPKDSGEYICVISTNPALELIHSLNVLYPPTVKPQPMDGIIRAKEGETVALSCEASGNPKPKISWKHGGRNYDDGHTFLISNIQKSQAGEYECIADNGVGSPDTAVITVDVVSAPKIKAHPSSGELVVKEGELIEISCEATGDPMPIVTWKKPGGEKPSKGRDGDGHRIVISEAHRSHAGSYECIANNSLGIFTSTVIEVRVEYPPEIKVSSTWLHIGEGSNVNLTCTVKGEPTPSVMWKRENDKVIHSNEHYRLKTVNHHHVLEIHHVKEEDFGRYECLATNKLDSVAENIHIIGTPQVPTFTSKPHGPHSKRFMLSWMVKSHTPVDEYSLMYRKKEDSENWQKVTISSDSKANHEHTHTYELMDLDPASTYEARLAARNKFGWSKQSEVFVFSTKNAEQRSSLTDSSYSIHSSWFVIAAQAILLCVCSFH